MKKISLIFALLVVTTISASAQRFAVKNNLLGDGLAAPNLALEFGLGKNTTLEVYGSWKWFDHWFDGDKDKYSAHWLVQPEFRFWTCEKFNGFFIGLHGHYAEYNVGGWDIDFSKLSNLKNNGYDGKLYGGGLTIGHQWILSPRWNLEMSIGAGYAHMEYRRFDPALGNEPSGPTMTHDYWGITKAEISLIFLFN